MTKQDAVTLNWHGDTAVVTLNRPEKRNALNMPMFKQLSQIAQQLSKYSRCRAVIIHGAGQDFCAGLDVNAITTHPTSIVRLLFKWLPGQTNLAQQVSRCWRKLPMPVICVIHGNCLGGGLQIALGADFRIATPDSRFAVMETQWGLLPDMGGLLGLRENTRRDQLLKLSLTSEIFPADTALELGVITALSDNPMQQALDWCEQFAQHPFPAIKATKRSYVRSWTGSERTLLARETAYQIGLLIKKDRGSASVTPEQRTTDVGEIKQRRPEGKDQSH
ncbi:crotonase/enoyl-CoA hydratase family protein [Thaumasiovibrio sp. DFM-14]|uniref:crotonase/enoyl-CoA hydratase family protein n=1 Tax=Thaumasiovibrio sp. DFM-14 TaxID=3384792 RepID=UPI0039A1E7C9